MITAFVPRTNMDCAATISSSQEDKHDVVNHPSHYADKSIEVIEYIKDTLTPDGYTDYCIGNMYRGGVKKAELKICAKPRFI